MPSAAARAPRSCRRRALCRASYACPRRSPARSSASCSCRRSCTRTSASSSRACTCRPAALGAAVLFEVLRRRAVLLHHPSQSFLPVIDFIRTTANDPGVIAIKQTVYRTGTDSELMEILVDAARKGKEVTVVVELMARFDEEANLNWAARLEEVGAHVVYGVVGHKTHAKMSLIVRREEREHGKVLRRYAHLSTGNYHPATARAYTDFGFFTANEELCTDVAEVFQQLTGLGRAGRLKHVSQSPFTPHKRTLCPL